MNFRVVILSIYVLAEFARTQGPNPPSDSVSEITYCQLVKDPSAFVGKRIRIRAVYSYMFEVSRLAQPVCCPTAEIPIRLDFGDDLDSKSQRMLTEFPKGRGFVLATFVGVFEGGKAFGTLGERFRLKVVGIERVEQKANPRGDQKPSWLPSNCVHQTQNTNENSQTRGAEKL